VAHAQEFPETRLHEERWTAEEKVLTVTLREETQLKIRLLNYPAWRVEVNGRQVQASAREGTGQMLVPVEAGANRVQISFARTWDRSLGGWISIIALILIVVFVRYEIDLTWIPRRPS